MNPEDLTVYKDPQTGGLKSLGFSIKSLFQANDFSLKHKGGNKDTKTFFENIENYSVPLPLALLHTKYDGVGGSKTEHVNRFNDNEPEMYLTSKSMNERLLKLAGGRRIKTRKAKRKRRKKSRKLFK
jgi:hypothetical protein|tara:strand:- start:147 stop:527 length:381 start_codon:yes stop_codon:yes gene_type:complete